MKTPWLCPRGFIFYTKKEGVVTTPSLIMLTKISQQAQV